MTANAPHDANGVELRPRDRVHVASSLVADPIPATVKVLESPLTVLVEADDLIGEPISVSSSRCTIVEGAVDAEG